MENKIISYTSLQQDAEIYYYECKLLEEHGSDEYYQL
jgi:hypothetical protein